MKRLVAEDVRCRHCGARVVVAGTSIALTTRERAQARKTPRCVPYEIPFSDVVEKDHNRTRLIVVAKCAACDKLTDCTSASKAFKFKPWPHECACGCGFMVQATREIEVHRYGANVAQVPDSTTR